MNSEEIARMIDAVTQYGEFMGGLRKQLVAQGFSEEVAEQLVLEAIKKAS
jgi:hypothetical protein